MNKKIFIFMLLTCLLISFVACTPDDVGREPADSSDIEASADDTSDDGDTDSSDVSSDEDGDKDGNEGGDSTSGSSVSNGGADTTPGYGSDIQIK